MTETPIPNPDPSVRTVESMTREIGSSREIIETRISGMDRAIILLQTRADQIPQLIAEAVEHLEKLHEQKFQNVDIQLIESEKRTDNKFGSVATQFVERDKRTEQLSLADKTAVSAALQAQKESAGATQESNSVALQKMENNFSTLISQGRDLQQQGFKALDEKINDVKSRLDRGEGGSSVRDPATSIALDKMGAILSTLQESKNVIQGNKSGTMETGQLVNAVVIGLIGVGSIITPILLHFAAR